MESQTNRRVYDRGMILYPSRVRRDLDVVPKGDCRSALALSVPANEQSVDGGGVSTPSGAVPYRGVTFLVSGLYERIYDTGMKPYHPLVRRDLNVGPRAFSGWGWGFHTVQGGINPGYHCFRTECCWSRRRIEGLMTGG